MGLIFDSRKNGDKLLIKFSGGLDEDIVLPTLEFGGVSTIIFNFHKLTSINSCGIRDWIYWINKLPVDLNIVFRECPRILIDQINMMRGFLPESGKIDSFFVPYYCEECDETTDKLYEMDGNNSDAEFEVEEVTTCNKCKAKAQMDVLPLKYFKFLKS